MKRVRDYPLYRLLVLPLIVVLFGIALLSTKSMELLTGEEWTLN